MCYKITNLTLNIGLADQALLGQLACVDYKILDEKERNYQFNTPSGSWWCDRTGVSNKRSPKWHGEGWYRFLPPAGTKIVEDNFGREPSDHCGASTAGYMQGTHPTNSGETVERTVCFQSGYTCYSAWSTKIKVRNCGNFFLYNLVDVKHCHLGYCAK